MFKSNRQAVHPMMQAALQGEEDMPAKPRVTLMIPWLAKQDQRAVFPNGITFDTPEQQEEYVRKWAETRTGFESNFKVTFYPGRYASEKGSILPVGDPTAYIADAEVSWMTCNLTTGVLLFFLAKVADLT